MKSVYTLLVDQGFIHFPEGESNLIQAKRAFFAGRVIEWMRAKGADPDFNLKSYLVALTYYKLDMADLKFEGNELLYRYRGPQLGGLADEFSKDNHRYLGPYHRPDQPAPAPGGADHGPEPSQLDE